LVQAVALNKAIKAIVGRFQFFGMDLLRFLMVGLVGRFLHITLADLLGEIALTGLLAHGYSGTSLVPLLDCTIPPEEAVQLCPEEGAEQRKRCSDYQDTEAANKRHSGVQTGK
jgi:hypothetical protein